MFQLVSKPVGLADLVHVLQEVVFEVIGDAQQKLRIDGVTVEEVVEVRAVLAQLPRKPRHAAPLPVQLLVDACPDAELAEGKPKPLFRAKLHDVGIKPLRTYRLLSDCVIFPCLHYALSFQIRHAHSLAKPLASGAMQRRKPHAEAHGSIPVIKSKETLKSL